MPARGDHDARRRDLSEAVWRVVAEQGFTGLTMRAVATEMGASTGLVTHYFPSKAALVQHALELAAERVDTMERHVAPPGLASLRAAILDVVPLDPERVAMNRVWVSSWDLALADPELGAAQRERYERWRGRLRRHVEDAVARGELGGVDVDADGVAATAAAFTHGLVTQALFDPEGFPAGRLEGLVGAFVEGLGR